MGGGETRFSRSKATFRAGLGIRFEAGCDAVLRYAWDPLLP